jgi:hypothetical protein
VGQWWDAVGQEGAGRSIAGSVRNVSSLARSVERRGARGIRQLRRELRGRQTYIVNCMPLLEAMFDERICAGVRELMAVSLNSALSPRGRRQCFGCCHPWSIGRALVFVLLVEFIGHDKGLVAGICSSCSAAPDLSAKIIAGIRRDLGEVHEVKWCTEPGHA